MQTPAPAHAFALFTDALSQAHPPDNGFMPQLVGGQMYSQVTIASQIKNLHNYLRRACNIASRAAGGAS